MQNKYNVWGWDPQLGAMVIIPPQEPAGYVSQELYLKAVAKLERIQDLYSVEMPALERCREIQKVIDDAE